MFKKIERSLALQFTGFVFLLILINGALFLIADFGNEVRKTHHRLITEMEKVQMLLPELLSGIEKVPTIAHPERLRIVDERGASVFTGELFTNLPMEIEEGFSIWTIGQEEFIVLAVPFIENAKNSGFIHIAEPERSATGNLPFRLLIYLIVSILISFITYVVGKYFARRSLKPAEEMLVRLEQFTQDASHELRTPLAILGSSLDLALKTKKYQEGITSAKEDLRQIAGLVEHLLETAKSGNVKLNMQIVNMSSLMRASISKSKILADASSIIVEESIMENVNIEADPILIGQVMLNLLSNAIKFSHARGRVQVNLGKESFSISDKGIGVKAHDLPNIFDRFYQADSSRLQEGFGLGLAFVQQTVEKHGWRIEVQSEESKGSTFSVIFKKQTRQIS